MPGSSADVGSPGGFVRPTAGILPRDFRRSEYGTVIPLSSMPNPLHCILEAVRWRGLERAPGPDSASDSDTRHGMRASVEHDASSEVRHDRPR